MKVLQPAVFLALCLSGAPVSAWADCSTSGIGTVGELRSILSRRAVEAIDIASVSRGDADVRLGQLVVRTGTFSLGSGDVGRPLGTGVSGIRALAREMKADSFRFLGWDYIPTPIADSCTMQKVEVEFIDTGGKRLYPVTFTFRDGRIVDAAGWSRSFESGSIANARH